MNFRTGLGDVRGLGSARSGTGHFWTQRMTAVSNLPLVVLLVWFIAAHIDASRGELIASVQNPFVALLLALAFVSILLHMRLGLQMVIEDYVHAPLAKYACLLANTFYVIALLAAALFAILKMNLGS
jgi:succinate dehydrogenase / fumarate reductase, membrane anchor subunit